MKKIILSLFIGIFLISLVSSGNQCGNDNSFLGSFPQNGEITLKQTCDSCNFVNLSSVKFPSSSVQNFNEAMTKNGIEYNYTFSDIGTFGCYSYTVLGDKDGSNTAETIDFIIGQELTTGRAVGYVGFIIILLFTFLLTIFGASKVRWKHLRSDTNKIVTINNFRYLKVFLFTISYFELMFLFGLSYKFFNEANIEGFTEFFNFIYQLFLNFMYPLMIFLIIVVFVIWINNRKLSKRLNLGLDK